MAGVWKRDGTVAVTNGNKKVTGTGTTFADTKNGVAKGHLFCITSGTSVDFYEVDYVVSNTELYLVQAYRGVTATGKAYEIITTFSDSIPEFARRMTAMLGVYQGQSDVMQLLLTSDAASVTVTAPDGSSHTMIPWKRVTSDGEGQAARAKTEADKAQAAASVAVNVVYEATAPAPDVWAPLSDSLRLFTGYGREVTVGADVVARYVNFARATTAWYWNKAGYLTQAAVNEARLESPGLLCEEAKTNLHKFSEFDGTYRTDQVGYNLNYSVRQDPRIGFSVGRFSRDSSAATHTFVNRYVSVPAGFYCVSALVKDDGAGRVEIWMRDQVTNANMSRAFLNFQTGEVTLSAGGVFTQATGGAIKKPDGWWLIWASASVPEASTLQNQIYVKNSMAEPGADSDAILCAYQQLEAGRSPTSYIRTNGAATTRAADFPHLPAINGGAGDITVACEVSVTWPSGYAPNTAPKVFSVRSAGTSAAAWEGVITPAMAANNIGGASNGSASVAGFQSGQVFTGVKSPAGLTTVIPAGKKVGTQVTAAGFEDLMYLGCQKGVSTGHLNGHIRNLRCWHRQLTDEQIKGLR